MSSGISARATAPAAAREENAGMWANGMKIAMMFMGGQLVLKGVTSYVKTGSVFPESTPAAPSSQTATSPSTNTLEDAISGTSPPTGLLPVIANPLWPLGTPLSIYVYLSTYPASLENDTSFVPSYSTEPIAAWSNITYGNWKDHRETDCWVDLEENIARWNGSLWADIVTVAESRKLATQEVNEALKDSKRASVSRKMLTRFYPKRKIIKVKNLMSKSSIKPKSTSEEEEDDLESVEGAVAYSSQPIVAHWSQNLTITLVSDGTPLPIEKAQPVLREHIKLDRSDLRDERGNGYYYPVVFVNDFWLLREDQWPINTTTTHLPLRVTLDPIGAMKFNLYATMQAASEAPKQPGMGAGGGVADMDELKRMLITANPYGLMLTAIATILHSIFSFLAFSSDVSHWRKKDKDLVGVSLRSIITNVVVQLVIMLYLYDSSEETSTMILATQGFGLLIEVWKISKVVDVRFRPNTPGAPLTIWNAYGMSPNTISFEDKKKLSEEELKSQEYDRLAFRLVGYAAIPLLIGYSIYSLIYHSYKGWYSFIISTLAQAIYMFGFAQLVPQLIINARLKSVAHLPFNAMVYKTIGTFLDDILAWSIKMPMLHRLATMRDDVVFAILCYQYWIYKVDPKRANEYGQVLEGAVIGMTDEEKKDPDDPKKRLKAE